MSYSWDICQPSEKASRIDPLYMEFPICESDQHQQYHFDDYLLNTEKNDIPVQTGLEPTAWAWSGDFNEPRDHAARPNEALIQTGAEDQVVQSSESDFMRVVLELQDKTKKELEELMETRISQVKEEAGKSRRELEETAARCCNEITTYIEKLQTWAAELKVLVDRAADLHGS